MDIYMTVGLGSFGKSTYCKKNFREEDIIAVDKLTGKNQFTIEHLLQYRELIIKATKEKKEEIVLDFSHDEINERKNILSIIENKELYNLHILVFYPTFKTYLKFHSLRTNRQITEKEKKKMQKLYDNFTIPSDEDFKQFGFKTINIYLITFDENT